MSSPNVFIGDPCSWIPAFAGMTDIRIYTLYGISPTSRHGLLLEYINVIFKYDRQTHRKVRAQAVLNNFRVQLRLAS